MIAVTVSQLILLLVRMAQKLRALLNGEIHTVANHVLPPLLPSKRAIVPELAGGYKKAGRATNLLLRCLSPCR